MVYKKVPTWATAAALLVTAVFVAGFFHESRAEGVRATPAADIKAPACQPAMTFAHKAPERRREMERAAAEGRMGGAVAGFLVPDHLYRRAGEFSCKVDSVIDTYTAIDKDIKSFGGQITEMEITGNDDGRQGRISCTVSNDKFNAFITYVRGKGKVLAERITASSKPRARGGNPNLPGDDDVDERELSLVTVQVVDEKIAKEVNESKGMLATSFSKSAGHFLAGLAVMVELFGWIAPYAMLLALIALPIVAVRRLRRTVQPLDRSTV